MFTKVALRAKAYALTIFPWLIFFTAPQAFGLQDEGFNVTTRESLQRVVAHRFDAFRVPSPS